MVANDGRLPERQLPAAADTQPEKLPTKLNEAAPSADSLNYGSQQRRRAARRSSPPATTSTPHERAPVDDARSGSRRVLLPEIKSVPWKAICHLTILYENGQKAVGSGFLVGPKTVVTAGHCVYMPDCGQATEVMVVPARQEDLAPYGWDVAALVDYSEDWRNARPGDPVPEHDFGAVFLPSDRLHQRIGHTLNFVAFSDADVKGFRIANVAGYPNHGNGITAMETDSGSLVINASHPLEQRILKHLLETYEGQSGGPVIHYNPATAAMSVFGIHTYGDDEFNLARRIDTNLAATIQRWVATPRPFMAGARLG